MGREGARVVREGARVVREGARVVRDGVREVVREGCYHRPWLIRPGLARPVGYIHKVPNECRVLAQDH